MSLSTRLLPAAAAVCLALAGGFSPAAAATTGVLTIQWDANTTDPDLSLYRVYLSTDSSIFSLPPATARPLATTRDIAKPATSTVFTSLNTASVYHVAVTAIDTSGNESGFSNVASAQPSITPTISALSPTSATEGDTGLNVTLTGTNFQSGAAVSFGPGVVVRSVDATGVPSRLVARIDVDPVAEVDMRDVVVTNPGNAAVTRTSAFQIKLDVGRVDVNGSSRIDGGDVVDLAAAFGAVAGNSGYHVVVDMNVDGVVDGTDLSLMLTYFGAVGPF